MKLEYKVPCGNGAGHGWSCCEGMLCRACSEVKRLRDAAAIAPPVAAGSVDTEEFRILLRARENTPHQSHPALVAHIYAWGAQQRHEGFQEGVAQLQEERDNLLKLAASRREWAEKAEANYKIVCDKNDILRAYAEAAQSKEEQWQGKAEDAMARVKELERESAHKQAIIDRLMLEYCPDEMTAEQVEEWGKHQVRATVGIVGSGPDAKECDRPCWTPDCGTF